LGALPASALPLLKEYLEREEGRTNLAAGKQKPIYDFRAFQIAWPRMVVYGFIVLVGLAQATSGVTGILLAHMELPFSNAVLITSGIIAYVAAYFIGRWVGTRCSRRGVVAILLIALLYAAFQIATDLLILPEEVYTELFRIERLTFGHILLRFLVVTVIISALALIGYWRGQKHRLSKYLNYLLGVLPAQTRDTVVELAFDEAQKVASAAERQGADVTATSRA